MNTLYWSPMRVFVIALLSLFIFAQVAQAASVGVKFDSGSKSLAKTWQDIKGSLPHEKIPDDSAKIKDAGSWAKDYGVGIAKIVGLGFVIAILSLLVGIIYGIFKLFRMCCCSRKKDEDEESESEESGDKFTWSQKWVPTILYIVFWVFLLTGMLFGLLNNPRFSEGVNDMGDSVVNVGTQAIDLGNGIRSNVSYIVGLIPSSIDGLQDQFSGVEPLASNVVTLSNDINATSDSVSNVTAKVGAIDAGNTSAVANLYNELAAINNNSAIIIGQMSDLTYQIAEKLHATYNDTVGGLDSKFGEINETVDSLQETANDIISQASDLVDDVIGYVDDGKSYDKSRAKGLMALFIVVIVVSLLVVLGYVFRVKAIFNIVAAFGFVFLFLLWLSGSIHFLLGMALYDACPVIDVTVKGLLPSDSDAASVLQGCLYEHRSVLDSLNISAYNLSEVFDYRSEFQEVAQFSATFNFSEVDDYFNRIQNLYTYNLTAIADNITVESFNWTDQYVYDALDALNNLTDPDYFSLSNYTAADPDDYGNKNESVTNAKEAVRISIETNTTIHNKTDTAKRQLIDAQTDIDNLLSNMNALQGRYDGIKTTIHVLETENITNSIAILDSLQANITTFFELGNCSFLGDAYVNIRTSLCETMQPAIDTLTVGQFLAGLALIPLVIIAEILSFRIPKCKNLNPCDFRGGDDDDYYDEEKGKRGAVGMDDTKYSETRNPAISATISAEPNVTSSANSSPDFSGRRKTIEDHFAAHPQ